MQKKKRDLLVHVCIICGHVGHVAMIKNTIRIVTDSCRGILNVTGVFQQFDLINYCHVFKLFA